MQDQHILMGGNSEEEELVQLIMIIIVMYGKIRKARNKEGNIGEKHKIIASAPASLLVPPPPL